MQRLRRLVRFVAFAYPVCLVLAAFMLRFASRRFWQVELSVYVPRLCFALPLFGEETLFFCVEARKR